MMKETIAVPKVLNKLVILMQSSNYIIYKIHVHTSKQENLYFGKVGDEMMTKSYYEMQKEIKSKDK